MIFKLSLSLFITVFTTNRLGGISTVLAQLSSVAVAEAAVEAAQKNSSTQQITTLFGHPIGDKTHVLTVGQRGPLVMQDLQYQEELAHFVRSRIPERVVHTKGFGAFGKFVVTNPIIAQYSKAKVFESVGKETEVAVRFSLGSGHQGSPDTGILSQFGMGVKLYTEEGNWDSLALNPPVLFNRDPIMFSSFLSAGGNQPQTNRPDINAVFDFATLMPETLYAVIHLFGDAGTPDGYRHMDAHAINPFRLVNSNGSYVYAKFHWLTNQGVQNLTQAQAITLAATQPDYFGADLFNNIAQGNFPSWGLWIQVITEEQARSFPYNPFDMTKIWSEDQYPLIEVGTLTLNQNPDNHFAQVEQMALSPANLVPGIEPTQDKGLSGRFFAYPDAQRFRLGVNYDEIPVNKPRNNVLAITQRDGAMRVDGNYGNIVNYYPNSVTNIRDNPIYLDSNVTIPESTLFRFEDLEEVAYDYLQPKDYFNSMAQSEKQHVFTNMAAVLSTALPTIQQRFIAQLTLVDPAFGAGVTQALNALLNQTANGK